ncbi:MAG: hemerythrin domain-containing protein [Acidimicrobiales bacterium]
MARRKIDVIELILEDHQRMGARLVALETLEPDEFPAQLWALAEELLHHEVAEEVAIYPVLRSIAGAKGLSEDRLSEQAEAERLLVRMEGLDTSSEAFTKRCAALRQALIDHAANEELDVLPVLNELVSEEERQEIGSRYRSASAAAGPYPEPEPSSSDGDDPEGPVVGPISELVAHIRGAVQELLAAAPVPG